MLYARQRSDLLLCSIRPCPLTYLFVLPVLCIIYRAIAATLSGSGGLYSKRAFTTAKKIVKTTNLLFIICLNKIETECDNHKRIATAYLNT